MKILHAMLCLTAAFTLTCKTNVLAEVNLPWSPEQATGEPDTFKAGDFKTAWATLDKNLGNEWITLEYKTPVNIQAIHIRETFNPGAICKVTAFSKSGIESVIWEGTSPIKPAPNIFEIQTTQSIKSKIIKIYLDTKRISGWNEIDAVQLIGNDASKQWAVKATASSTYASKLKKKSQEPTYETLPPSVVKTIPQAGDMNVDPSLKEIHVTFSKDMLTDRMWAFCQVSSDSFPKVPDGQKIRYLPDNRTCVMPVELVADKIYVTWINRGRYNSFRDTQNNPAVPYLLMFKTKTQ